VTPTLISEVWVGLLHVCKKINNKSKSQNIYPCPNKAVHITNLILDSISKNLNKNNVRPEFFKYLAPKKNEN
jgi:hypothetical protein